MALAFSSYQQIFDPDFFILGGGISRNIEYIKRLKKRVFELDSRVKITATLLGEKSGVVGAAYLALKKGKI